MARQPAAGLVDKRLAGAVRRRPGIAGRACQTTRLVAGQHHARMMCRGIADAVAQARALRKLLPDLLTLEDWLETRSGRDQP